MIAKLKGIIDAYGDDCVVIDVGGVGYRVFCSTKTLAALPSPGEAAELHTEMLVSETAIRLVGFATPSERDWFQLLDNVQGVGTRVALAILSTLTAGELANAIAVQDKAMVGRAPGVGPKLAQRIVSVEDAAARLAVHPRTLNRRLQAEGLNFRQLKAAVQYEAARLLLRATDLPVEEIAAALGYAEVSSFSRSFAAWAGCGPAAWRRSVRHGGESS